MQFVRPTRHGGELNQVERWKLERHPLEVAAAIRTTYAREGVEAIAAVPGEAERLKWVGLYPQKQGGDAFMLRVKVPGGRLTAAQARAIGGIARSFAIGPEDHPLWGNGYCDLTTRQDVQLHWIHIADVPRIWDLLEEAGLTTVQACGDSARNVLGCPVAGLDRDEVLDATPVVEAITAFFTGNREYANLPRKFKLSVTGCREDCAQAEINDVGMWPARLADGTLGFNLLVGGGLSDGPRMASDIDVFVAPEDAVEIARGVAQVFGELGNRENRGLARMRYLVQELGPETFRAELQSRVALDLRPAGEELTRRYRGDHVGVHPHKDAGLSYVGCSVTVGRMSGSDLSEAARLAEEYGNGEIRLATDQNFVLPGVRADRLDDLLNEELLTRHSPFPPPFSRGVVACTGSEFCRFAIVETKARAAEWARALDARFADRLAPARDGDGVVRLHFSGCSASCAQPQIADIGFRGATAPVGHELVEGVDVGLGGSLGSDAAFVDWVASAKPVDEVVHSVGRLLDRFLEERRDDERFHEWARRSEMATLRAAVETRDETTLAGPADDGERDRQR